MLRTCKQLCLVTWKFHLDIQGGLKLNPSKQGRSILFSVALVFFPFISEPLIFPSCINSLMVHLGFCVGLWTFYYMTPIRLTHHWHQFHSIVQCTNSPWSQDKVLYVFKASACFGIYTQLQDQMQMWVVGLQDTMFELGFGLYMTACDVWIKLKPCLVRILLHRL